MMNRRMPWAVLFVALIAQAEPQFQAPVLLTSGGQSADPMMMKTVLTKEGIEFVFEPQATPANLTGVKSVVMVLGGSSKGLGAAKISSEDELARMTELLAAAHKQKLPVLAVHLGGKTRRGALSDPFNRLGIEGADYLIVVAGGDDDGMLKGISEERQIPYRLAEKILDVGGLLQALYAEPVTDE